MEGKKTNVLAIILTIIIIGLIVFIIYDKKLFVKVEKQNTQNNSEVTENANNDFKIYANHLKKEIAKYDSNNYNYQFIQNRFQEKGYSVYIDKDMNLYVKYVDEKLNKKNGAYKLAENVLNFYVINVGQDVSNNLYFINYDGTVGEASVENGEPTIKTKDLGYKNIVTIINGTFGDEFSGAHSPIFIDINGNMYHQS